LRLDILFPVPSPKQVETILSVPEQMPSIGIQLGELYLRLGGGICVGWLLGKLLPPTAPIYLGKFLFWVGVPLSIVGFLRQADLSGQIWIAPLAAWAAIFLGGGLAWGVIRQHPPSLAGNKPTQASFLLAAMFGNTGYLGFPITLALVGEKYFGWALFYDMLGSLFGAYGLGIAIAARFGQGAESLPKLLTAILINPALWSFGLGLIFRQQPLPPTIEQTLKIIAWGAIACSLILIGMRLSQLQSWGNFQKVAIALSIKMLIVPLILGSILSLFGIQGAPLLVIVLQMGVPPAFATLVLAEVYDLNRDLAVSAIALGSILLLLTLPLWLYLY